LKSRRLSRTNKKVSDAKNISTKREATNAIAIGCWKSPGEDHVAKRANTGATT